ncbi:MAG: hypothetical protein QME52_01485 [Bacteroidota bacterium]|nr:hypothetical protein [Bacteroidota bacterium]
MFSIRTSNSDPILIDMWMSSPSVYLDYSVIVTLANDTVRANAFRDALAEKNGTLAISSAHLIEACGLGIGPTFARIKSFLDSIGNKFAIINFNPAEVIEKEKNLKPNDPCPVFDLVLAKQVIHQWNGLSPITAGALLNNLQNNPRLSQQYKQIQIAQKSDIKNIFDQGRYEYRNNPIARKNIDMSDCIDPGLTRTEKIYYFLRREAIRTNDDFVETDSFDFWHSVVAVSYNDYVVHDKKWARRLKAINLPPRTVKVFAGIEIDNFILDLQST